MEIRPITFREASSYVNDHHRHHKAPTGNKFSLGCYDNGNLCGVAIVGRPVSRYLDDGLTAEVTRVCTDGTKNACSMLYGACFRVAKAMGYKRIVTYTLESERGTSLRASGWECQGQAGGTHWTGERNRGQEIPFEMKTRWMKEMR